MDVEKWIDRPVAAGTAGMVAGAAVLVLFSLPVKVLLGVDLDNLLGHLLPVVVGGTAGGLGMLALARGRRDLKVRLEHEREITRKLAESEARAQEAEQLLWEALEHSAEGFVLFDADDRLVLCNRRFKELYPQSAHRMVPGVGFEELVRTYVVTGEAGDVGDDPEAWIQQRLELHERHRREGGQLLQPSSGGRWVQVSENPTASGGIVSLRTDVTERIVATEALRESEERYRQLLDTLPTAVVVHTVWEIVWANRAAARLLGAASPETLVGVSMRERIHPESLAASKERTAAVSRDGTVPPPAEMTFLKLDGTPFQVEARAAPISLDGAVAVQSVFHDITARKKAERALVQRTDDLVRSNADLEQFAYVASHDLKEPLRMVASYVRLLEKRFATVLDDEGREYVAYAADGALRMNRLIDGLLDYSRVGRRGLAFESLSMSAVATEARTNLKTAIQESGAEISCGELPVVRGDPIQLLRLVQNLLDNAIKYRRPEVPPRIEIAVEDAGRFWRFRIEDQGIGMDPVHADKIFMLFQRLHGRDAYPGTGIGLALCKRIVEFHGGRIGLVRTSPGEGAVFEFTLPKVGG